MLEFIATHRTHSLSLRHGQRKDAGRQHSGSSQPANHNGRGVCFAARARIGLTLDRIGGLAAYCYVFQVNPHLFEPITETVNSVFNDASEQTRNLLNEAGHIASFGGMNLIPIGGTE